MNNRQVCVANIANFFIFRSLTPNPKLSEIVAAVRNLQGAVQDDTGVPTGQRLYMWFNIFFFFGFKSYQTRVNLIKPLHL